MSVDHRSGTSCQDLLDSPAIGTKSELEKFKALFQGLPAAIALLQGPDFVIEMANDEYFKLVGRKNIIGKPLTDALPEIRDTAFPKILRNVLATGESYGSREQEVFLRQDETESRPSNRVYLDFTYRRIQDSDGNPYGVFVFAVDVTEKVLARSSIQIEQVKLEAVFANASAALAILRGPEAIYEKTNASYDKLFTDRPFLGKPLLEAVPELRGQKFPDLIFSSFATGKQYVESEAHAFLRRTTDGALEERFFDQSYTRITDRDGKPYGVLIQAVDVTERVNSRKKLAAAAENNVRLLQNMPTAFFSVTPNWVLNYANPMAEKVWGISASEVLGRSLWEAFPGLVGSRFGQAYERAMKEGVRIVTEDYYPDFDRWYEAWCYPFDQGLAVSFFDITDRKADELKFKAEKQKLEAIFYSSATALVFFQGPELVYEMINSKYQELVPQRELIGKPLLEALPELESSAFPALIKRVFETGESLVTYEEAAPLLNSATGEIEERYFDTGISRVNDGEGKPYGVFVQATDVTERVHSRRKIEEALDARDTFLSIASHELRTPITAMKLQTQIMKRAIHRQDPNAFSSEKVTRLVENTERSLNRMNLLVEDMLDIARIQAGKLSLHREPTDFRSFIGEVIDRYADGLAAAGIRVQIESSLKVIPVLIDRFRIEQVLANLITNAIKYAPNAPVLIALKAEEGLFKMIFKDHGPGIKPQDHERIFQRFERLVSGDNVSGMGLGLYIVRQIVIAHGGKIFAQSDSTPGAKFILELPLASE